LELGRVLEAATGALACLDSDKLCELERRVLEMQALLAGGARIAGVPEIMARHRVFAGVVRATGENLRVLEGAGSRGVYGAAVGDYWRGAGEHIPGAKAQSFCGGNDPGLKSGGISGARATTEAWATTETRGTTEARAMTEAGATRRSWAH
jgi:hypothetical protein